MAYTVLYRENDNDKWDRFESAAELADFLTKAKDNPGICEGDIWTFLPEADAYAYGGAEEALTAIGKDIEKDIEEDVKEDLEIEW